MFLRRDTILRKILEGLKYAVIILFGVLTSTASAADIDGYSRELHKHVINGYVDYKNWSENHEGLDRFIKSLENTHLDSLSHNEKLSLLINAYNAGMIWLIFQNYPLKSVLDIQPKVFGQLAIKIDGKLLSLDEIENDYIRKMGDNRIHFAIVCGSKGCPDLSSDIYSPDSLDQQLDAAARNYLSQEKGIQIEADSGLVMLSSIFDWFGSDFGEDNVEKLETLSKYLPEKEAEYLRKNAAAVAVKYMQYDWSLNGV